MTYASVVAADTPVAWWKLNETSGTSAADSGSGTAANGTYTNTYTLGRIGIDSLDAGGGTSVLFGSNGYVTVGTLPSKLQFASGTDFSVEAWVAFSGTSNGPAVVTEAFAGDGNVRYMLGFYSGSAVQQKASFGWYNGSWRLVSDSTDINDGGWHHLVGTYDGGANQLELWVDGASVGTLTPGGTQPTGTETLYLGRRWDSGAGFNGWIDEVALYSAKLTSTQIGAHYGAFNASDPGRRVSQVAVEYPLTPTPNRRASELVTEFTLTPVPNRRASQVVVEAIVAEDVAWWGVGGLDGDLDERPWDDA